MGGHLFVISSFPNFLNLAPQQGDWNFAGEKARSQSYRRILSSQFGSTSCVKYQVGFRLHTANIKYASWKFFQNFPFSPPECMKAQEVRGRMTLQKLSRSFLRLWIYNFSGKTQTTTSQKSLLHGCTLIRALTFENISITRLSCFWLAKMTSSAAAAKIFGTSIVMLLGITQ